MDNFGRSSSLADKASMGIWLDEKNKWTHGLTDNTMS